jgi:hypothetical protein
MVQVITTRAVKLEERTVLVPFVIMELCPACGAKAWPSTEIERARRIARLMLREAA